MFLKTFTPEKQFDRPLKEARTDLRASLLERQVHRSSVGGAASSWTYHSAEHSSGHLPLLVVGGYLGIEEFYSPFAREANKLGIDVITMDPPRRQSLKYAIAQACQPEKLLAQMTGQIAKDTCELYDLPAVNAAGHSMGGPAVVSAAKRHPERFRSVSLYGSAGVSGHNVRLLASRVPTMAAEASSELPRLAANVHPSTILALGHYLLINPTRTIGEAIAVGCSNVAEDVRELGALGVKTAGILFEDDSFFKKAEIIATIGNYLDAIVEPDHGHVAPQAYPEEVAAAQLDILGRFDKQSASAA